MARQKNNRQFSLKRYFQVFKEGDFVAVTPELSMPFSYSRRICGKTGKVVSKRGSAYYIEVKELNKPKKYLLRPIHLKKIEVTKK